MTKLNAILTLLIATQAFAQNAPDRFRQFDQDHDGKLSRDEVAAFAGLRRLFERLDADGDGGLSPDEIRVAAERFPGLATLAGEATERKPQTPSEETPGKPDAASPGDLWDGAVALFENRVRNLDATVRFYRDGLGMKEVSATADSHLLEFGGSYLRLRRAQGAAPKQERPADLLQRIAAATGFRFLSLAVPDRSAVEDRLVKSGFPRPRNFGTVSMAVDPDGMVVEIISARAGEPRLMAGLIVADEDESRNFLTNKLGIEYEGSRPMPAALGSGKVYHFTTAKAGLKVAQATGRTPARSQPNQPGILGLALLVPDVAAVRRGLKKQRLEPADPVSAVPGSVLIFADPDGNQFRIASLDSVAGIAAEEPASPLDSEFQPRIVAMGDASVAYIDPEFESANRRIVFQDPQWNIWIGEINGATGDFKSDHGCDLLVAEDTVPAREAANGPEFALDRDGWSVFFTRNDVNGVPQTWRARLTEKPPRLEQLTHLPGGSAGALASQAADLDRTWFGFLQGDRRNLRAFFAHSLQPDEPVSIPDYQIGNGGARFIAGSADVLYARKNPETGRNEVVRRNLDTGHVERLLAEADVQRYYDAWIFPAPELGGVETLVATLDRTRIAFYRKPDGEADKDWRRVAELQLPGGFAHRFIFSMEPILGIADKVDRSWVLFEARSAPRPNQRSDNSVWIASPGIGGRESILRRVDDGAETGVAALRREPETLAGDHEVFLYYGYRPLSGGRGGLRRAATGLTWPEPTAAADDSSADPAEPMFRRAELPGLTDTPVAVNGFAIADLNRDGLPDIIATRQVQPGFFAGDRLDLLINRGGMTFEPHTIQITGSDLTAERFGASAEIPNLADFNGDGFLDLFVTRCGGARFQKHGNTLLLSDGAWDTFRDVSAAMGVQAKAAYNRQSSIGDVNGDGWLDIAIGCDAIGRPDRVGVPHSRLYLFRPGGPKFESGTFVDISGTHGLDEFGGYTGDPSKDRAGPSISLRDLDNDGDLDLVQTCHADMTGALQTDREAVANYAQGVWVWKNLLRETDEFRFERVTGNGLAEYARLEWNPETERYDAIETGSGLPYLAFADTDNDGLLDALAAGPNSTYWAPRAEYTGGRFWRNLGDFQFQRDTESSGLASLDWNYKQIYQHNGWELSPRMRDTSPRTLRRSPGVAADRANKQPGIPLHGPGGNHPYFSDVIFGDFDNDGWQDVVVLDRSERTGLNAFAQFYRNERGIFRLVKTADTGLDAGGISGEAADLDGDGWLDLVLAADPMNSSAGRKPEPERFQSRVFLNNGASGADVNHWLRLTFKGIPDAELIGARIELTAGDRKQSRWIHSNRAYKSGGALDAHFGLGQATSAAVTVTLLDGRTKSFPRLAGNQNHVLEVPAR